MLAKHKYFKSTIALCIVVSFVITTLPIAFANSSSTPNAYQTTKETLIKEKMTAGKLLQTYDIDVMATHGLEEDRPITREEFYKILMMCLGETGNLSQYTSPSFTDMPVTHKAFPYIERAKALGYTKGIGNGLFGTGKPITVRQAMLIFQSTLNKPNPYAYDKIFEMERFFYNIAYSGPDEILLRGQAFFMFLKYFEAYDMKNKEIILAKLDIPEAKKETLKFEAYVISNNHNDFLWEGAKLYELSPTYGTELEDMDNYNHGFEYLAGYLENCDTYNNTDYLRYKFANDDYKTMFERYYEYKDNALKGINLTREDLDPSNEKFKYSIKFYEKMAKLEKAYEAKANAYKQEQKSKGYKFSIENILKDTEQKLARLEAYKAEINYQHMHDNYKSYSTADLEAMAYKVWGKAYIFEDFMKAATEARSAYRTYATSNDKQYEARINELYELRDKVWISYYYFKGAFRDLGFHNYIELKEYEFDQDIPVYVEMTKAYYDQY